jgi:DNA-binding NarL/FixJ family response regulator
MDSILIKQHLAPVVLVVEESSLIALDLEQLLADCSCRVVGPFVDAREALERLEREHADVAIVDYGLDGTLVEPLLHALNVKGIPFALCVEADRHRISARYPKTPIIAKPYTEDDVARMIDILMACRLAN